MVKLQSVAESNESTEKKIVYSVLDGGVNCLDTAAAYGDSEVVIGKWLKTISKEKRPFVVTKIINVNHNSLEELWEDVFAKVEASKERLGLRKLLLVMLHHCEDYFGDERNVQQVFRERGIKSKVSLIS